MFYTSIKAAESGSFKALLTFFLLCTTTFFFACSSTEQTQKTNSSDNGSNSKNAANATTEEITSANSDTNIDWDIIKDELSIPNKMRSTVLEEFSVDEQASNANNYIENRSGYRVQIDFTRNVNTADSLKNTFNYRIRQLAAITYKAEAYVIYRPPYYRIRVGDFKDRSVALEYTKLLKRYYPSSWVVADEINTSLTPKNGLVLKEQQSGRIQADSSNYRQN